MTAEQTLNLTDYTSHYKGVLRNIVKSTLENWKTRSWTYQGLGMIRVYFTPSTRMHIWVPQIEVHNVSKIHTHPWDFASYVVCGQITNNTYTMLDDDRTPTHMRQLIHCGAGGGLRAIPENKALMRNYPEIVNRGQWYTEKFHVPHETAAVPGTVTLVHRTFKADTEHAYVFWDIGDSWVSAEPRPATDEEIDMACRLALEQLA